MAELTPYQLKIIERYYRNRDTLDRQRVQELVSDLYLTKGKKLDQLWRTTEAILERLGLPRRRIEHIVAKRDPALVATVVNELLKS